MNVISKLPFAIILFMHNVFSKPSATECVVQTVMKGFFTFGSLLRNYVSFFVVLDKQYIAQIKVDTLSKQYFPLHEHCCMNLLSFGKAKTLSYDSKKKVPPTSRVPYLAVRVFPTIKDYP